MPFSKPEITQQVAFLQRMAKNLLRPGQRIMRQAN